jgi:CP family cyanate transporter-like MFS transporter
MLNVRYDLLLPVIEGGLGLTTQQFYLCIVAPSVAAIPLAFISGLLTDRIGVKRVILYGSIVTAIGALLRLVSTGFIDLFLYSILMGAGLGTVGGNVPKLVGQWFHVRQIYLGIALFMTSLGIGPVLALATGAMWSSYFQGFLVMGLLLAAMCVVWGIWAKDRPREFMEDGKTIVGVPFKEGLLVVMKSKPLWLIIISYALASGVITGYVGGMPLVLVSDKGVPEGAAGIVVALGALGYIGGIVLWSWVAEKVGYMKPIFCICAALAGVGGFLTYMLAPGSAMWAIALLPGLFNGAVTPLIMQMPLRLKGIGLRYAGNATGLITAFGHVMSFIMLPFLFTPMWGIIGGFWAVFIFFCVFAVIAAVLFSLVPEVGRKYMVRTLKEAAAAKEASASS